LLPLIAHITVRSSQSNDPKIKIQKQKPHESPTRPFHLFSYIKREMREREIEKRKKKEIRNKEERRNKN
jgi:hypothetical protein